MNWYVMRLCNEYNAYNEYYDLETMKKEEKKIKKHFLSFCILYFLKVISFFSWEPIVQNFIDAPTGSAANDASGYGPPNKNSTCNDDRCNLGIG
jgi:hypothetical protein